MISNVIWGIVANVITAFLLFILSLVFLDRKMVLAPWVYRGFIPLKGYIQKIILLLMSPWLRIFLLVLLLYAANTQPNWLLYYSIPVFLVSMSFLWKPKKEFQLSPWPRLGSFVNKDGTVYFVGEKSLFGIPDVNTFNSWGVHFSEILPINSTERLLPIDGTIPVRQDGYNNPVEQMNARH